MLAHPDTCLEVERVGKRFCRSGGGARARLREEVRAALLGRPPRPPADRRDAFWALRDVSFEVRRGQAVGVIGLNGSGKTTLLRLVAGQLLPDEGEVRVVGRCAGLIDLAAGMRLASTGRENIYIRGAMLGLDIAALRRIESDIVAFADIGEFIDAPVTTYSSGMRMRLAFSIVVHCRPEVLVVDEVLSVGDFTFRNRCLERVRTLREEAAFLLVSHNMGDIARFCDHVLVLSRGRIAFRGEPQQAIEFYERLQESDPEAAEVQRRAAVTGPAHWNEDAIRDVRHEWCDAAGNPVSAIARGDELRLRVEFVLSHSPRMLIVGIPAWTAQGEYVTGFSTEVSPCDLDARPGERMVLWLRVPAAPFNPGTVLSSIGICDGPEFLYRAALPPLTVEPVAGRHWGIVAVPHEWVRERGAAAREAESGAWSPPAAAGSRAEVS
jgi:ABC-type polysaccharide/polyol phosphate transport system ATPase subunit